MNEKKEISMGAPERKFEPPSNSLDTAESVLPITLFERLQEGSSEFSDISCSLVRKRQGRHSELLQFRDPDLVVKRITRSRNPATARATVLREFEALTGLWKRLDSELKVTIPRALLVLPEARTLVLGRLSGTPLPKVMRWKANRLTGAFWRRGAWNVGFQLGDWLRKFHSATAEEDLFHDHEEYHEQLSRDLSRCKSTIGLGNTAKEILDHATEISKRSRGDSVPTAARHGDFIPQNILIARSGVRIVDFENFSTRAVTFEDAGTFIGYIRMLQTGPFYSRGSLKRMNEGFVTGYGQVAQETILNLYILKAQVTIAAMVQSTGGIRSKLGYHHRFPARLLASARNL